MSAVDNALGEITLALAVLTPQLEGLDDYLRLNIKDETRLEVAALRDEYAQRHSLLTSAKTVLTELVADGHPNPIHEEVSAAVYADLENNNRTIDAAFALFSIEELATNLGLSAGAPESK